MAVAWGITIMPSGRQTCSACLRLVYNSSHRAFGEYPSQRVHNLTRCGIQQAHPAGHPRAAAYSLQKDVRSGVSSSHECTRSRSLARERIAYIHATARQDDTPFGSGGPSTMLFHPTAHRYPLARATAPCFPGAPRSPIRIL